jgi:hypothetical protein
MAVSDKWLDEAEQFATAEYLAPDAIIFLQARLKRLIREYKILREEKVQALTANLEAISSGPPIPYDPETDAQQVKEKK